VNDALRLANEGLLTTAELAARPDFTLGAARISPSSRSVTGPGGAADLEPRVMQVLVVLADAAGQVVTREALFQRCWGGVYVGEDSLNRAARVLHPEPCELLFDLARVGSCDRQLTNQKLGSFRRRAVAVAIGHAKLGAHSRDLLGDVLHRARRAQSEAVEVLGLKRIRLRVQPQAGGLGLDLRRRYRCRALKRPNLGIQIRLEQSSGGFRPAPIAAR